MQEDVNTPTENQVNGENEQNMSKTQGEQQADAGQRPALYGRKVLSFVRRSARLDARLRARMGCPCRYLSFGYQCR